MSLCDFCFVHARLYGVFFNCFCVCCFAVVVGCSLFSLFLGGRGGSVVFGCVCVGAGVGGGGEVLFVVCCSVWLFCFCFFFWNLDGSVWAYSISLLALLFQRCLSRLRESRNELYAKRRGIGGAEQPSDAEGERESNKFIKMLISTELQALKEEEGMDCEVGFSVCPSACLCTSACLSVCMNTQLWSWSVCKLYNCAWVTDG